MERLFKVGDRVERADGHAGTVTRTDFRRHSPDSPFWVTVNWDASDSISDRLEDGLVPSQKPAPVRFSPSDLKSAMSTLGLMWGLDRPLHNAEMGRALRLTGRDVGATVQTWLLSLDKGGRAVTGPVQVAIAMMLAGATPPDPLDVIVRRK